MPRESLNKESSVLSKVLSVLFDCVVEGGFGFLVVVVLMSFVEIVRFFLFVSVFSVGSTTASSTCFVLIFFLENISSIKSLPFFFSVFFSVFLLSRGSTIFVIFIKKKINEQITHDRFSIVYIIVTGYFE